ncbi:uncharacterized protein WM294_011934 [Sarcoramphus papa]
MAPQGMRSIVWILCIWGLSVLPECISQSVGFISLFCTAGALCQKAECNICVPLHFPEVSLALKVPDGLRGHWRCTDYASRCRAGSRTVKADGKRSAVRRCHRQCQPHHLVLDWEWSRMPWHFQRGHHCRRGQR